MNSLSIHYLKCSHLNHLVKYLNSFEVKNLSNFEKVKSLGLLFFISQRNYNLNKGQVCYQNILLVKLAFYLFVDTYYDAENVDVFGQIVLVIFKFKNFVVLVVDGVFCVWLHLELLVIRVINI